MTALEVIAALEALGFVADGATREEILRVGTARSPVLGGMGGERRKFGGRARFSLPGTDIKATVGGRTTYLYRSSPGSQVAEIAHLCTRDVTSEQLADLKSRAIDIC